MCNRFTGREHISCSFFLIFIYLSVLAHGLSIHCVTWDLSLQHVDASCGMVA